MKKTIAVLPGDGIGPEVMDIALDILKLAIKNSSVEFECKQGLIGGAAFDVFQNHFPKETIELCQDSDAILFGSVGGPINEMHLEKWQNCERNAILGIRKAFELNTNVRPVKVYPELSHICPLKPSVIQEGIDMVFFRELVGGIYFGEHKSFIQNELRTAQDVMEYNEDQIAVVAHQAFQAAQLRKKKLTSVDKSNVLDCSRLWKEVVIEVSKEYPEIELEHILVDNCAMQIIKNPSQFDVVLTPNMFGDILSDAAAVLPGSLGLMPSASFNKDGFALYEPAGGSAPDIAGKNLANPIAQILCSALMLRHSFNMQKEAELIEKSIEQTIKSGKGTADICQNPLSSSEFADAIKKELSALLDS